MGIPSYFSYIIKNYSNIIRNLQFFKTNEGFEHLFMDCNSIIYDSVNILIHDDKYKELSNSEFENVIIENVIHGIEKYIYTIKPTKSVFIAFDGVAPFAKMQQQRTRRYKSHFMNKTNNQTKTVNWNTSAITPGTEFMNLLSKRIELYFTNLQKIIISCSNSQGEGEHKLMECIRTGYCKDDNIALYGLDADLIMLSIFHLKYCKNIWVFREAPEFIKSSIPVSILNDTSDLYFLDIDLLADSIVNEMNCINPDKHRVYDYVFLCFLLGNDFLPHFPAMNIRTHGIQALMDIYRLHIGNVYDKFLISKTNCAIQWKNVGLFIKEISKNEHQLLLNEYNVRDKFDKRQWLDTTEQEKNDLILNIPVIYRGIEKYISPNEYGWEKRYYKSLFDEKINDVKNISDNHSDFLKNLCNNYLEGLEWVFKYYSSGCPNWKWKYNYHYPPLFNDLIKYIPHFETDFIIQDINSNAAFTPELQLSYVLPISQLDLLPKNISSFLKNNYIELYPEQYDFHWAFCRYFWESHPLLPEIPIELLQQWDIQFKMCKK
jgi:5'-3' exonuclease